MNLINNLRSSWAKDLSAPWYIRKFLMSESTKLRDCFCDLNFVSKTGGTTGLESEMKIRSVTLEYLGLHIRCRDNILTPAPPSALYVGLYRNLWDVFSGPM